MSESLEQQKLRAEFEKIQLEKEILQQDLNNYAERFAIEKKQVHSERGRFWAETVRLLGISLISGFITYLINDQIENRKKLNTIEVQEHKLFSEGQTKVYEARNTTDRGVAACNLLAQYKASSNAQIKTGLLDLQIICESHRATEQQQSIIDVKDEQVKDRVAPDVIRIIAATEKQKNEVEQKLTVVKGEERKELLKVKNDLENRLDSVISSNPSVDSLSTVSRTITENVTVQVKTINQGAPLNEDKKPEPGYPRSTWFKEGYFLSFDDMKIVLEDLQGNGFRFSLCVSTSAAPCPSGLSIATTTNFISAQAPLKFSRNGFDYRIRLDRIGSAGKNPFTRAAYITFEKYKAE